MNIDKLENLVQNLKFLAEETIRNCMFSMDVKYFGTETKANLLLPSGDGKYNSFWVRDAAMMAESGLVSNDDLKRFVEIFAFYAQNGSETVFLENRLEIPPYAVADHVNYDGSAVFFPGTYSSGSDQGNGGYGYFPPFCDNYYFIMLVGVYVDQTGDKAVLDKQYHGISLRKKLEFAFSGYNIDEQSGLCVSDEERYTVDWGFVDTVKKTGKLLMASLLRYNAAITLSRLLAMVDDPAGCAQYQNEAQKIRSAVLENLYDESTGWFYSATGIGHQYDVWGTAYAVYSGFTRSERTLRALHLGYKDRTAVVDGYVRHILTDQDYSASSAWESSITNWNEYQNGAYWATPTGWYAYALYQYCSQTEILSDFLEHTNKYSDQGAPFEWMDADTKQVSGLRYGTSGVLPYIGAKRILEDMLLCNTRKVFE